MALWQKMIMIYLAIAIGCAFWQPAIVFNNAETPLSYFDIDSSNWNTTKTISTSSNLGTAIDRASQEGSNQQPINSGGTTSFNPINFIIDTTYAIIKFVQLLFNIIFAPIDIMVVGLFPVELIYILGVPLVLMLIISIMGWIKTG